MVFVDRPEVIGDMFMDIVAFAVTTLAGKADTLAYQMSKIVNILKEVFHESLLYFPLTLGALWLA